MNENDRSENLNEAKEPRRDLYGPLADSITWDGSRPKTVPVVVEPKPIATEGAEESKYKSRSSYSQGCTVFWEALRLQK